MACRIAKNKKRMLDLGLEKAAAVISASSTKPAAKCAAKVWAVVRQAGQNLLSPDHKNASVLRRVKLTMCLCAGE